MSGALQKITDIVCRVQGLDMTPSNGINAIIAVLEVEAEEGVLLTTLEKVEPTHVNTRTWLIICLGILLFGWLGGCLIGWGLRTHTTNDRYMNSLAERHEAAAKFYNERTDQLIHANESTLKGIKK